MLPVSGLALVIGEPCGYDELAVLEAAREPAALLGELARRVVATRDGDPLDVGSLPAVDLGALALLLRRAWLGELIGAETVCGAEGCRERIEISFTIAAYLDHHRPRRPRGVMTGPDGWYVLAGARFRVPTVADLRDARASDDPAAALAAACIDAPAGPNGLARRLDRALDALAPRLDDAVGGSCPECGALVAMRFDPVAFVVAELREAFDAVHVDTDTLARAYGWSERAILRLPHRRRRRYASLIAAERAAA